MGGRHGFPHGTARRRGSGTQGTAREFRLYEGAGTIIYTLSVYPMGVAYMAGIGFISLKTKDWHLWRLFAAPGNHVSACSFSMVSAVDWLHH